MLGDQILSMENQFEHFIAYTEQMKLMSKQTTRKTLICL